MQLCKGYIICLSFECIMFMFLQSDVDLLGDLAAEYCPEVGGIIRRRGFYESSCNRVA